MKASLFLAALVLGATAGFAQSDKHAQADALNRLHAGNRMEIEMGELAGVHAASAEVKGYGRMLVRDHGAMDRELTAFAKKHGIALETKLPGRGDLDRLRDVQGADFERLFGEIARRDHRKDIDDAKKAERDLHGTPVGAFLAKAIPTLEKHLRHAAHLGIRQTAE